MNFIFIAPPAAGKGTLSRYLFEKYGIINISTGDLLRNVDKNTPLGKEIDSIISTGQLISNDIVKDLLYERLKKDDIKNGFILDGFPREYNQIKILDDICTELNIKIDYIVYLNIPYEVSLKRVSGRRICPKCGSIFNIYTASRPLVENHCNNCNSLLTTRKDDNEESLKTRFNVFLETTGKVLDYYKDKENFIEIDASGTPDENVEKFLNGVGKIE